MTSNSPAREKRTSRVFTFVFFAFSSRDSRHELAWASDLTASSVRETTTLVFSSSATIYRLPSGLVSTILSVNPGRSNSTPQSFAASERRPRSGFGRGVPSVAVGESCARVAFTTSARREKAMSLFATDIFDGVSLKIYFSCQNGGTTRTLRERNSAFDFFLLFAILPTWVRP